ncbi:MAG: S8 family serine peptidase [Candidatus Levyibacteriota bacterium]
MYRVFIVFLFLLSFPVLFASKSFSATVNQSRDLPVLHVPAPVPDQNRQPIFVPNQLLIQYKLDNSPAQISAQIENRKKIISNPIGYIKIQTLIFLGKAKPLSSYEDALKQIQKAQKDTQTLKSEIITVTSGSQTVKVTLKNGTDLEKATQIYKSLPQVKNVEKNYIRFSTDTGSRISSMESGTDPLIKPNKYIITFAPGQSPTEIQAQVNQRAKTASVPLLGTLRIASENTSLSIQGEPLPEEKLNEIKKVTQEVGERESKQLLKPTASLPETLKNMRVITTDGKLSATETIAAYSSLPGVLSVEPVHYVFATATPNDTGYSQQWSLPKIQAPTAWDTTKGSDSVTVAVIDSGVDYNHPDLAAHVIKGPDYFNNDNDPMDTCGHGTHVSGTIGAITNNGSGVAGINWDVKILGIKTMDLIINPLTGREDCGGDDGVIAQAIQYAADNGAKVINMSLGGPGACTSTYQNPIDYAKSKGVTIVVAAGNDSVDAGNFAPADCQNVITVGATGPSDERASYSNYGSIVSIAAPGGNPPGDSCSSATCILSTYIQGGQEGYASAAGTSMASPHVAGAAALLLSVNPNLTPDQVKSTLIDNADPINTDRPIGPRLNLAKAVAAVSGGSDNGPTNTPTPTPTGTQNPTATPTPTGTQNPTATPTTVQPSATPTPIPKNINISFLLPGIGSGGNSVPTHTQRNFRVTFMGEGGNAVGYTKGMANFQGGAFVGTAPVPDLPDGSYQLVLGVDGALPKFLPGFITVPAGADVTTTQVNLTTGDINVDGTLDVLDYNMMIACMQRACQGNAFTYADLNDDNIIDAKDLNILLRSFATRGGD